MRSRIVAAVVLFTLFAGSTAAVRARSAQGVVGDAQPDTTPTTVRVRGTITGYDSTNRMLSLTTETGVSRFEVSTTSRVRRGGRKVEPQELQTLKGYRAAVRYSDSDGHRTVESVNVFGRAERTER